MRKNQLPSALVAEILRQTFKPLTLLILSILMNDVG